MVLSMIISATQFEVPFTFAKPHIPLIAFEASIDGGKPRQFILDTGNGDAVFLSEAYAKELGLKLRKLRLPAGAFSVGSEKRSYFSAAIDGIQIGHLKRDNPKVRVSDLIDNLNKSLSMDSVGNVGYGLLKEFALTVDYANKKLIFDDHPVRAETGIDFKLGKKPLIMLDVMVDGNGPFKMVLDTGASASGVSPSLAKEIGLKLGAEIPILGALGADKGRHATARFTIGIHESKPLTMVVANLFEPFSAVMGTPIEGIVGYDFLKEFKVRIDYPHKRLTLSK